MPPLFVLFSYDERYSGWIFHAYQGFAALLEKAISDKRLTGIKVAPRAPRISHLFFADDSYLFLRGTL
ncbi:unnamed protein product [Linum trigynum]|uniref:Uncharacterized protein n=1 Tax=Linum trigynum TaxID=586398 RepID=A0AAV2DU50_9ROSI